MTLKVEKIIQENNHKYYKWKLLKYIRIPDFSYSEVLNPIHCAMKRNQHIRKGEENQVIS